MRTNRPILLVEDDQVDAMTVRRALKEIKISNPLHIVGDGEEALAHLHNAENECPCIILLDLNMPRMNGIEFLRLAKSDDLLRRIPVIVLTSSQEERDKVQSFTLGVAGYMLKPVDYQKFVEIVRAIVSYWSLSEIPPGR